jgi:hypothetical protein
MVQVGNAFGHIKTLSRGIKNSTYYHTLKSPFYPDCLFSKEKFSELAIQQY